MLFLFSLFGKPDKAGLCHCRQAGSEISVTCGKCSWESELEAGATRHPPSGKMQHWEGRRRHQESYCHDKLSLYNLMLFGCLSYAAHCDTFSSHVDWFLMVIKVFSLHCISVLNAMRNKSLLIENLFETGCDHCNPVWKSFPCWLVFPLQSQLYRELKIRCKQRPKSKLKCRSKTLRLFHSFPLTGGGAWDWPAAAGRNSSGGKHSLGKCPWFPSHTDNHHLGCNHPTYDTNTNHWGLDTNADTNQSGWKPYGFPITVTTTFP